MVAIGSSQALIDFTRGGVVNVKADYGAKGDGTTDDTNAIKAAIIAAFGNRAAPKGSEQYKQLYFPAGVYVITSALPLESISGGIIYGDGRLSTQIKTTTSNVSIFVTNGFQYSLVKDMRITCASGTGVCFDADWDNTGTPLQSNTFSNVLFEFGSYGCRIGYSGFMGSEFTFLNCFWQGHAADGLSVWNANALQITVLGGNFQACGNGITVHSGCIPVILSVGFQLQTNWDINVLSANVGDAIAVHGCRTESPNFINSNQPFSITGCNQVCSTSGYFVQSGTFGSIDASVSMNGSVAISGGAISVCQFGRTDWVVTGNGNAINISTTTIGGVLADGGSFGVFLDKGVILPFGTSTKYMPDSTYLKNFYSFMTDEGYSGGVNRASSTADFTITRSTSGYDLQGLVSYAANTFRRNSTGLLIEPAATNVTLWCRDLTNSAWTKTNCTAALTQTGTDGTTNAATLLTATAANGTCLQAITLASSARQQSAFVKRVTGTGVVSMTTDGGATWTQVNFGAAYNHVSIPSQTLANPSVGFRIATSGDAIAIDFVQNETGTVTTSPIATTTAAVTRAADVVSLTIPTGASYLQYRFSSGGQIVGVSSGSFTIPNTITGTLLTQIRIY